MSIKYDSSCYITAAVNSHSLTRLRSSSLFSSLERKSKQKQIKDTACHVTKKHFSVLKNILTGSSDTGDSFQERYRSSPNRKLDYVVISYITTFFFVIVVTIDTITFLLFAITTSAFIYLIKNVFINVSMRNCAEVAFRWC